MTQSGRVMSKRSLRASIEWVRLGTAAALAFQVACGGDDPIAPRIVTAVNANSATALTAVVGAAAAPLPSVFVRDQDAAPMSGVSVTFAVASGDGSITGGLATTDGSGIATVGSWTLGPIAGANTLSATVSGLAPVTFTATGTAGAPATLTKSAGDGQSAIAGTAVPVAPAVTVRDASGNVVSNTMVTFSAALGDGSVTSAQAISTQAGVATVGSWILGSPGANTVTASGAGLQPVTFSATAVDPCSLTSAHTFGTTSNGALAAADCRRDTGAFIDLFTVTLPPATAYRFTQTSTEFNGFLFVYDATRNLVAANDEPLEAPWNPIVKALLVPGSYMLGPSSRSVGSTGAYSVTSAVTTSDVTNCQDVFVGRGLSTSQSLQSTDCVRHGRRADELRIVLKAGEAVTISMTSTAVDAVLEIRNLFATDVVTNNDRDATTTDAQIVYMPTSTGYHYILATSNGAVQVGAYTLSISAGDVSTLLASPPPHSARPPQ